MDAYDNFGACTRLNEFVDGLSNWYVRRSRDRFWSGDKRDADKLDGYWTLYECLITTSKLIAPFTPFLAEALWQNLSGVFGGRALESAHLCDYPTCDEAAVDATLSERMQLLRDIASLGRKARMDAKLKVRQPLAKVEVILADDKHQHWLESHDALLRDELNVKQIDYTKEAERYIAYEVLPNFKRLGPRVGRLMPKVKQALAGSDGGRLLAELTANGKVVIEVDGQRVELDSEDLQVRLRAKPGWAAAHLPSCVVVLSTDLTPELIREGLARDLIRLIQDRRKELNCEYTDRIRVGVATDSEELRQAIQENAEYIRGETLAAELSTDALPNADGIEHEIAGERLLLFVVNASGHTGGCMGVDCGG
jgi:isoleucyl-tRNA synthetase